MAEETDWYEVLGVSPSVDAGELRRAYLSRAQATHPDKQGASAAQGGDRLDFNLVARAWEVLGSEATRREYDARRAADQVKGNVPVWQEVDVEDMGWDETREEWTFDCRCGDVYLLPDADLVAGRNLVHCRGCSYAIRVVDEQSA